MTSYRVGLIQTDIALGDIEENMNRIRKLLPKDMPDFLVLPEMAFTGFDFPKMRAMSKESARILDFLGSISESTYVIGGSFPEEYGNYLFNSTYILRRGERLGYYWKSHLVGAGNLEEQTFDKGDILTTFADDDIRFGVANCYDLRFPEIFRGYRRLGCDGVFLVAQFKEKLRYHFNTLLRARAIENQSFVVACNRVGGSYFGGSLIIDPRGEVLLEASSEIGYFEGIIDMAMVKEVRTERNDHEARNDFLYRKFVYNNNFIGVAGLVIRGDEILLTQVSYGAYLDKWMFPGGYLDRGEDLLEGAAREVQEETGIKAKGHKIIGLRSFKRGDVTDIYIIVELHYISGEIVPDGFECKAAKFVKIEEILKEDLTDVHRSILECYVAKENSCLTLMDDGRGIFV